MRVAVVGAGAIGGYVGGMLAHGRAPFAEALADAGIGPRVVEDIRAQAWRKLMGNAVFNPLSVLTRATLAEISRTSSTRSLAAALVEDVLAVALALGRTPPISIGSRAAGTERVGDHRTPLPPALPAAKKAQR